MYKRASVTGYKTITHASRTSKKRSETAFISADSGGVLGC